MKTTSHLLLISLTTFFLTACGGDAADPKAAQISANNTAKQTCTVNSDTNNDGTVDDKYILSQNADSKPLAYEVDGGADGSIEVEMLYSYDENGNQTHMTIIYNNADNSGDKVEMDFTYDSSNRLISSTAYSGEKIIETTIYEYPDTRTIVTQTDSDNDGIYDRRRITVLDDNGNDLEYQTDYNNDGIIDFTEQPSPEINSTSSKEPNGDIVLSVDLDSNGSIDMKQTMTCKDI